MIRKMTLAALIAALPMSAAFAKIETISAVDVTTDLAAVQNPKAAAYWANLETDLEAAVAKRMVGRIDAEGPEVSIDISEVELANGFERAFNLADAVLAGQVKTRFETTRAEEQTYDLRVSLADPAARVVSADGTVVVFTSMDTPMAYETLVDTFAQAVVDNLNR